MPICGQPSSGYGAAAPPAVRRAGSSCRPATRATAESSAAMSCLMVIRALDPLPEGACRLVPIFHSETQEQWSLIRVRGMEPPPELAADQRLLPGDMVHRRSGKPYFLNGVARHDGHAPGHSLWVAAYKARYCSRPGPHWLRPLTTTDGAGWQDPVDGQERFTREQTHRGRFVV